MTDYLNDNDDHRAVEWEQEQEAQEMAALAEEYRLDELSADPEHGQWLDDVNDSMPLAEPEIDFGMSAMCCEGR